MCVFYYCSKLQFIPSKKPLLLLIQGYSLEQVGQILENMVDNTGVNCFDELKLGLLETANKFVIISEEVRKSLIYCTHIIL